MNEVADEISLRRDCFIIPNISNLESLWRKQNTLEVFSEIKPVEWSPSREKSWDAEFALHYAWIWMLWKLQSEIFRCCSSLLKVSFHTTDTNSGNWKIMSTCLLILICLLQNRNNRQGWRELGLTLRILNFIME